MWKFFVSSMGIFGIIAPAQACRVAAVPYDPSTTKADVIIVGRVFNVHLDGDIQGKWFSVRLEAVPKGEFPTRIYSTGWATGPGSCGPRGPDVEENDQVVIYFRYFNGKPVEQGWTKTGVVDLEGALGTIPLPKENVR